MKATEAGCWVVPTTSDSYQAVYTITETTPPLCEWKCTGVKVCRMEECEYLCYHMYKCQCYDFKNGHLCKHIHCVHSMKKDDERQTKREEYECRLDAMGDERNMSDVEPVEYADSVFPTKQGKMTT